MKDSVHASFKAVHRIDDTDRWWAIQRLPQDDEFGRYHAILYSAAWDRIQPLNDLS